MQYADFSFKKLCCYSHFRNLGFFAPKNKGHCVKVSWHSPKDDFLTLHFTYTAIWQLETYVLSIYTFNFFFWINYFLSSIYASCFFILKVKRLINLYIAFMKAFHLISSISGHNFTLKFIWSLSIGSYIQSFSPKTSCSFRNIFKYFPFMLILKMSFFILTNNSLVDWYLLFFCEPHFSFFISNFSSCSCSKEPHIVK